MCEQQNDLKVCNEVPKSQSFLFLFFILKITENDCNSLYLFIKKNKKQNILNDCQQYLCAFFYKHHNHSTIDSTTDNKRSEAKRYDIRYPFLALF